jgi:hypothetical protein
LFTYVFKFNHMRTNFLLENLANLIKLAKLA